MKNRKNGFTLIELIAVLVIMAILALIVTPLVMSIIRKAKVSADKRSIDAYGRSIELAIASYLLDNGSFPTSIDQLTIEYSGDEVVCSTTQLNPDSSVYLTGCTVGGRSVDGYTYGKEEAAPTYTAYEVGDEVTYNNVAYRVIKNSGTSESTVTLLKSTPITSSEISSYLSSTEVASKVSTSGTYAQMAYYSAEDCVSAGDVSGCSSDYSVSDVKQLVDVWKTNYASGATEARLITLDELSSLGYELRESYTIYDPTVNTPTWLMGENYGYWTMSRYEYDSNYVKVWNIRSLNAYANRGSLVEANVYDEFCVVRPVITLSKSVL